MGGWVGFVLPGDVWGSFFGRLIFGFLLLNTFRMVLGIWGWTWEFWALPDRLEGNNTSKLWSGTEKDPPKLPAKISGITNPTTVEGTQTAYFSGGCRPPEPPT